MEKNFIVVISGYEGIDQIFGTFTKEAAYKLGKILKENPTSNDWASDQLELDRQERWSDEDYENIAALEEQRKIGLAGFDFFANWEADQICIMGNKTDNAEMECVCVEIREEFPDFPDQEEMWLR